MSYSQTHQPQQIQLQPQPSAVPTYTYNSVTNNNVNNYFIYPNYMLIPSILPMYNPAVSPIYLNPA